MTDADKKASSLTKALEVLDLVSISNPYLRAEDLTEHLGLKRSTAYRYIKELCTAGLLAPFSSGMYSLGPRIIELERLLEITDPLYIAGQTILPSLSSKDRVFLLHNIYKDRVLCIYQEGPEFLQHGRKKIYLKRARGLPFPMFQGAASLAILAFSKPHRIRDAYLKRSDEINATGLGKSWDDFRKNMGTVRKQGYALSHGHITQDLSALAVPILLKEDNRLLGSLTVTYPTQALTDDLVKCSLSELHSTSERIASFYLHSKLAAG